MPRKKKPHIATLDEVIISRDGEYGEIAHRDPTVGGVSLKIGSAVALMSDQWVPRGDVLRCLIHDDEERRQVIEIDGRDFTLEEFGTMLTTHAGWGMRIVFVPDSDLEKPPVIVVREPEE